MIVIKDFKLSNGNSQISCSEQDLLKDKGFLKLKMVYEYLETKGYCHVKIKGGDYDGSIAKFTPTSGDKDKLYSMMYSREGRWTVKYYWDGRLSWKGKRNNPQFTLMDSTCEVFFECNHEDEVFQRVDLKKGASKLLEKAICDVDSKQLSVGDKVLYMNLRYGCGGKLSHGVVKGFKAHVRDGYVSVLILNSNGEEESELKYPHYQIYKKDKL